MASERRMAQEMSPATMTRSSGPTTSRQPRKKASGWPCQAGPKMVMGLGWTRERWGSAMAKTRMGLSVP
jgi:hypothetical protein